MCRHAELDSESCCFLLWGHARLVSASAPLSVHQVMLNLFQHLLRFFPLYSSPRSVVMRGITKEPQTTISRTETLRDDNLFVNALLFLILPPIFLCRAEMFLLSTSLFL